MVAQTQVGSTYSVKHYLFYAVDVGNAAGTLLVPGSGGSVYPMAWDGSVVAVTWRGSGSVGGTLTTGTLTPIVMINGTAVVPTTFPASLSIMPSTPGSTWRQEGQTSGYRVLQDQTLGLVYDKSGTVAPTSVVDITAEVVVLHENVRY